MIVNCRLKDINTHCLAEFRKHWECLDDRNHQLWQCRPAEWKLNECVYSKMVRNPKAFLFSPFTIHREISYTIR